MESDSFLPWLTCISRLHHIDELRGAHCHWARQLYLWGSRRPLGQMAGSHWSRRGQIAYSSFLRDEITFPKDPPVSEMGRSWWWGPRWNWMNFFTKLDSISRSTIPLAYGLGANSFHLFMWEITRFPTYHNLMQKYTVHSSEQLEKFRRDSEMISHAIW